MSRLVIGPSLEEQETEARWQLEQTRSNPKPWRGSEPENTRQTLLLSAAIAKLLREGKARSYYDPERRELVFFRPKPQTPPPVE